MPCNRIWKPHQTNNSLCPLQLHMDTTWTSMRENTWAHFKAIWNKIYETADNQTHHIKQNSKTKHTINIVKVWRFTIIYMYSRPMWFMSVLFEVYPGLEIEFQWQKWQYKLAPCRNIPCTYTACSLGGTLTHCNFSAASQLWSSHSMTKPTGAGPPGSRAHSNSTHVLFMSRPVNVCTLWPAKNSNIPHSHEKKKHF